MTAQLIRNGASDRAQVPAVGDGAPARRSSTRAFAASPGVLAALVLFAAITVLWALAPAATSAAVLPLYVVPVTVLAGARGLRAGLSAAAAALALSTLSIAVGRGHPTAAALAVDGIAFVVVGGIVGRCVDQRSRSAAADTRWFEMSNDLLVEASLDGYFTRLSARWEQCLGWTRQELMSRPFREFLHPDDVAATMLFATALDERPGEVVNFENRYRAKDGTYRWLLWCARSDENRKYAVARDITERKALEQERQELLARLEAVARTDMLTGLPNRRSWEEKLHEAIAEARRHGRPLTLAMVDLDRFKQYNDTHGHVAGDRFLAEVAVTWRLALRSNDFLARYGGEEFVLLLPDCGPAEALTVVERLRAATLRNETCSVGVAHWRPSDTADELVSRADAALYDAKRAGRDRVAVGSRP